jgi:hypothetical protein
MTRCKGNRETDCRRNAIKPGEILRDGFHEIERPKCRTHSDSLEAKGTGSSSGLLFSFLCESSQTKKDGTVVGMTVSVRLTVAGVPYAIQFLLLLFREWRL